MPVESGRTEPIRILYLIWNLKPAGAERQLLELLRRLDRKRFEPYLVVFKTSRLDETCTCPVVVIDTKSPRWGRIVGGLLGFVKLLRVLRRVRPRILHSFLPELTLVYGAAAAKLLGVPVFVCNRRASVWLYQRSALRRWAERCALKVTDVMAANAKCLSEELVRVEQFPRKKIVVIPNGVNSGIFRPGLRSRAAELGWPAECCVVGIVANFRSCKRHDLFVEAARMVRETNAETRFLMVGNDAGMLPIVRLMLADAGLEDVTRIVNGCSEPEEYYGTMNVLVCASDTEGLSNALLEGMACGLAVVATDVGGNAEVVHDGVNGILVPSGDALAMAEAIQRLADDRQLRGRMGMAGRGTAMERFSVTAMVEGYDTLYAALPAGEPLGMAAPPAMDRGAGNRRGDFRV